MSLLVNAYSTLREPPPLDFPHVLNGTRGRNHPDVPQHLRGFIGWVLKVSGQMTKRAYHVMRHIERTQHDFSFTVEDANLDAMSRWGWRANAIFFLPNSTVTDPSGHVLIPEQDPDAGRIPYPDDARERKVRTDAILQSRGIRVPASLPPVIGQAEVDFRKPYDVARRCLSIFAASLRAESVATGRPIPSSDIRQRLPLAFDALSPVEAVFLSNSSPEEQEVVGFGWRYEALAALQWALGLTPDLPWPDKICDVPAAARLTFDNNNSAFLESASLRPTTEILDTIDLHYRLQWAARQARLDERPAPAGVLEGVIQERRHALNWLIQFEYKDWDDVTTPT